MRYAKPLAERVRAKLIVVSPEDCWGWLGHHDAMGRGRIGRGRRGGGMILAHRAVWEVWNGPIPEGMEIDHLCHDPGCCNPGHMEVVDHAENMRRNRWSLTTHCPAGHEYTPDNTRVKHNGWRDCRACERERRQQRKAPALG